MKTRKIIHYKFVCLGVEFKTFKEAKTWAYFKMNKYDIAWYIHQVREDEVIKTYALNKQERRIICRKIYDKEKKEIEEWNKRQLKLFET